MAVAEISDVETSLMRSLTSNESQYVLALLERAENLLLVRIPDLDEKVADDAHFRDMVAAVEAEAVARVFRNPEALKQESEGNYSYSLNFKVASGLLDILDEEWSRLGAGGTIGSVAPKVDAYARNRYGDPSLNFQYGWPAYSSFSDGGEFWV